MPSYERQRADIFDPFVLGQAPDDDATAGQITVLVPVHAAGGALAIDPIQDRLVRNYG